MMIDPVVNTLDVSYQIKNQISFLSEQQQMAFFSDYKRNEKSKGIGLALAVVGLHYAYLKKWGLLILFLVTLGCWGIWYFIDLIRVMGLVQKANDETAMNALMFAKSISPSEPLTQTSNSAQLQPKLCADCGKYYDGTPKFCPNCGTKLIL